MQREQRRHAQEKSARPRWGNAWQGGMRALSSQGWVRVGHCDAGQRRVDLGPPRPYLATLSFDRVIGNYPKANALDWVISALLEAVVSWADNQHPRHRAPFSHDEGKLGGRGLRRRKLSSQWKGRRADEGEACACPVSQCGSVAPGMPLLNLCLILLKQNKQMGCGEQTWSHSEWRERWGWTRRPCVRQELPVPHLPSQGRPAAGALRRALGPQLPFRAWSKTSSWSLSPCRRASLMFSYNNFLYSMKKGGSYFCCKWKSPKRRILTGLFTEVHFSWIGVWKFAGRT